MRHAVHHGSAVTRTASLWGRQGKLGSRSRAAQAATVRVRVPLVRAAWDGANEFLPLDDGVSTNSKRVEGTAEVSEAWSNGVAFITNRVFATQFKHGDVYLVDALSEPRSEGELVEALASGRHLAVDETTTVGRAFPAKEALCTGVNFEVNDDQVARKHARVEGVILEKEHPPLFKRGSFFGKTRSSAFYVHDLAGTAGTYVDGKRVRQDTPQEIHAGSTLCFGPSACYRVVRVQHGPGVGLPLGTHVEVPSIQWPWLM